MTIAQDGRRTAGRRKGDRRKRSKTPEQRLVEALKMQARTRAAANRVARYEPTTPERFLEWEAAEMIELLARELEGASG